jgi:hypothetical protein
MRMLLAICAVALVLPACATRRTLLVNAQGEELRCETSGAGFGGAVMVPSTQNQCIADALNRGYVIKQERND